MRVLVCDIFFLCVSSRFLDRRPSKVRNEFVTPLPPPPPPPPSAQTVLPPPQQQVMVSATSVAVRRPASALIMCLKCGVQFKYAKALKQHSSECGIGAKCPFCPLVLRHRQMLVEHVETHRPGYCP